MDLNDVPVAEWTPEEYRQAVTTKEELIRYDRQKLRELIAEYQVACPHPLESLRDNKMGRDRVCTRCGLVEREWTFRRLRNYGDVPQIGHTFESYVLR